MGWTHAGDEKVRIQRDLCILSCSVGRTRDSGMGRDAIVFRKGYINMDGEDRHNTADLNR
jgi:hypothetical protein